MFRCDNCGGGYSSQAASSWTACPRCLAKDRVQVPLTFELGWQRQEEGRDDGFGDRLPTQARGSREVSRIT